MVAAAQDTACPVVLEANFRGAWNHVLEFDAGDDTAQSWVRQGVEALAAVDVHLAFRVRMKARPGNTLLNYSARHGWTDGKPT